MEQVEVPYQHGHDYGIGVNTASGKARGRGVQGERSAVEGAAGGSGGFQLSRVQSTSQLEDHLGISVEASGGVGLFSASARFGFARDCKVQQTSLVLLIKCTEQFGFEQLDEPALNDKATESAGNPALFGERYGDAFVRGMETGSQFFGVIRVDTKTEDSRQKIDVAVGGSYAAFSAEGSTNLSSHMKSEEASADVYVYYEGGRISKYPTTPEELLAAANEWRATVKDLAKPYKVTLAPYVIADGPAPPNEAELQHQRDVLARCAKLRSQTLDKLNQLDYMLDPRHQAEFPAPAGGGPDLNKLRSGLASDLDLVAEAASYALEHAKDAKEPESYVRDVKQQPDYVFTVLPADLPKHTGAEVTVPDFVRDAHSIEDAQRMAADSRLTVHWVDNGVVGDWAVLQHDPAAGMAVAPGTTMILTTPTFDIMAALARHAAEQPQLPHLRFR
jgi:hypothetical protein